MDRQTFKIIAMIFVLYNNNIRNSDLSMMYGSVFLFFKIFSLFQSRFNFTIQWPFGFSTCRRFLWAFAKTSENEIWLQILQIRFELFEWYFLQLWFRTMACWLENCAGQNLQVKRLDLVAHIFSCLKSCITLLATKLQNSQVNVFPWSLAWILFMWRPKITVLVVANSHFIQ